MKRELVRQVNEEFSRIDKYLEMFRSKYGTIFYDGMEYICSEAEEHVLSDDGTDIYLGGAYCTDAINVSEDVEESDGMDQIDIEVDVFHYERTEEKITLLERFGTQRWKGGYLGI